MCATNFLVISRPVNVCIRTDSLEYEKLIQESLYGRKFGKQYANIQPPKTITNFADLLDN